MQHDPHAPADVEREPRTQAVREPTVVGPGRDAANGRGWFIGGLLLAASLLLLWRMDAAHLWTRAPATMRADAVTQPQRSSPMELPRPQPVLTDMAQARAASAGIDVARDAAATAQPTPGDAVPERPVLVPLVAGPVEPEVEVAPEEALADAVRAGTLRPATPADMEAWKRSARAVGAYRDGQDGMLGMMDAYVVLKDMRLPSGLAGAHAAVFLLPPGVPLPRGPRGHGLVLDQASGACMGVGCSSLRP